MESKPKNVPIRVGMISLGCAKNLVDSEIMLGTLMKEGIEITNDANSAVVVIVNTCSFIDSAQEESVDTILESAELREAKNRGQGLIVSGCLPQRFRDELPKLLPEVDAFMGIDQVARAGEMVREALERRKKKLQIPSSEPHPHSSKALRRTGRNTKIQAPKGAGRSKEMVEKFARLEAKNGSVVAEPLVEVNLRPNYIPDYG